MPHTSMSPHSATWRGPLSERLLYVRGVMPPEIDVIPCGDGMHFRFMGKIYLTRIGMKATGYEKTIRYYADFVTRGRTMDRYSGICKNCKQLIIGGGSTKRPPLPVEVP